MVIRSRGKLVVAAGRPANGKRQPPAAALPGGDSCGKNGNTWGENDMICASKHANVFERSMNSRFGTE
jgi:hypothetical protein